MATPRATSSSCSTNCAPATAASSRALAFLGTYRFNLFSNFTLYLHDPDRGDEIEQVDRRTFYGGAVSLPGRARFRRRALRHDDRRPTCAATTFTRSSGIPERVRASSGLRANDMHQTLVGAYVNEEITPASWLRVNAGGRADLLSFAVDDRLRHRPSEPRRKAASDAAHQFSPKASLIVTPLSARDATARSLRQLRSRFSLERRAGECSRARR